MWDIYNIIRQNNQASLEYMMEGLALQKTNNYIPAVYPLDMLASKMQSGPPNLGVLASILRDNSGHTKFAELVRTFLSGDEKRIIAAPKDQRVKLFCKQFAKKYYPLPFWAHDITINGLINSLPVELYGFSYDVYENLEMRDGYLLLLSLLPYPFLGDDRDDFRDEGEKGARVALLDLVSQKIGKSIMRHILKGGWTPAELHKMTDGTQYDGIGSFADWVFAKTGCYMLDANWDNCAYIEGWSEPVFEWSQYNVESLAAQYPKANKILSDIDRIVKWLEKNLDFNFDHLVRYLESNYRPEEKREIPSRAYDHYEMVSLEMVYDEDDYEEEHEDDPEGE